MASRIVTTATGPTMAPVFPHNGNQTHVLSQCNALQSGWRRLQRRYHPTNRLARTAAVTDGSAAPPPPPLPAPPAKPAGVAAATKLLEAVPRAMTVRELRELLQQAQAHGCLTTAHSVAMLVQLGTLAASLPAGDAAEARRIGGELAGRLGDHQLALSPALRALTERAVVLLGLKSEAGARPGPVATSSGSNGPNGSNSSNSSKGSPSRSSHAEASTSASTSSSTSSADARPRRVRSKGGNAPVAPPPAGSTGSPLARKQQQPQQQQQQPQQQPQQQKQPRQQPQKQRQQQPQQQPTPPSPAVLADAHPPSTVSVTAQAAAGAASAAAPAAAIATAASTRDGAEAAASTSPPSRPQPPLPQLPPTLAPDGTVRDGTQAAAAPVPPLDEALRLAWGAVGRSRGQDGGSGGAPSASLGSDAGLLEAALQQHPPTGMSLSDVAEVLQLLAELRLLPRYEWLCGARDRLQAAMEEVEAARAAAGAAAGEGEGAATQLEDLQAVYHAAKDLTQMCWEADPGRQQHEGQGTPAAAAPPQQVRTAVLHDNNNNNHTDDELQQLSNSGGQGAGGVTHADGDTEVATVSSSSVTEVGEVSNSHKGLEAGSAFSGVAAAGSAATEARVAVATQLEGNGKKSSEALLPESSAAQEEPGEQELMESHQQRQQQQQQQQHEVQAARVAAEQVAGQKELWSQQAAYGGAEAEGEAEVGQWQWDEPAQEDAAAALQRLESQLELARGAAGPATAANPATASSTRGTAEQAVQQLSILLAEVLQAEAASRAALMSTAGGGSASGGAGAGSSASTSGRLTLTAERLAALLDAASLVQPGGLPSPLLAAAVRLLVAMRGGGGGGGAGGATYEHVAPVVAACAAGGYVPPAHLVEQLAVLAFASSPVATSTAAAPPPPPSSSSESLQQDRLAAAAASVRALHVCGHALGQLGCRLNNKQFGAWVEAVARRPRALSPSQLVQLLAACVERGFTVRSASTTSAAAGAIALLAAAVAPPDRLQRLSAAEAATVARFAGQQGLQLSGAAAVLQHLAPRLRDLAPGELAALLPALHAAGALSRAAPAPAAEDPSSVATAWLGIHSAALLPRAEALQLDEFLPLLRAYDALAYRPPPLLLLGMALSLEAKMGSAPLLPLLQSLQLLLCSLSFPPNEGLAAAIKEDLVPRLMVAATAAPPPQAATARPLPLHHQTGLTMAQRLQALDVLAAARVRPHPAQLAALLEVGLASEGLMRGLPGDDLVRLLWRCVAFRALPSWRFLGEWLEASAAAMQAGGAGSEAAVGPQELARAGWCLAQMGLQPDRAWQVEYHAALLAVMQRLDAEGLSLAAHSVLALRVRPAEEWLEGLMRAALARMELLDAASAARLLHFAAAAELQVSKDWMQSFFLHTLHLLGATQLPAGPTSRTPRPTSASLASPDQVALMLRALAQLGFRPPAPWLAASLERLRVGASALSPACFPVALSSLARLCPDVASDLGPASAVDELVRFAHDGRDRFTALELTWFLDTLGCHYPAYRLPGAAEANLVAALRRREALEAAGGGAEQEGERGDVAAALGDAVSGAWLQWAEPSAATQ